MNKKILIPIVALTLVGGSLGYGYSSVSANTTTNELSPMIQRLVERFNLNKNDVTKFVSEEKLTRQAEMQKAYNDKLNALVKDGKLTESQKTAIIAKHNEMKANKQNIRNMSREEKQAKMRSQREAFEAWAKSQGIDLSLIKPMGNGFGEGKGFNR